MLTRRLYRARHRAGDLIVGRAFATVLAAAAAVCQAQELPNFRKGLWEFSRTIDGGAGKAQAISTKKCTSPTDDMRKQNEMLTKAGCKFSAAAKSGNSFSFTSQCSIGGVSGQSKSVISVESDSAYKLNVESQQGAVSTKELLVAKRIADC